ncbi:MAG: T9SS type A sorting domain-containing protein [Flavobacteriales bacterium]|nr:T9SS type A sorting domain-containing protein [Flavobacteriales bacterium]
MKPHRCGLMAFTLMCASCTPAQDYVTADQYAYTVLPDLVYGIDTNYVGLPDTLRLDLYKPIGNPDVDRPLLVCAHGGSWLGGCKDDPNGIVPLVERFVRRGYVVASINYRLGWHKDDAVADPVAGFPPSLWPEGYRAFYAADSLELVRAIYRGMQDMKGAIRFLLERSAEDSTCSDKVFVAGESAGAFIALTTAFLDRPEEKPASCGALPGVPLPDPQCANLTALNCTTRNWDPLLPAQLQRPDLGPVQGRLNLSGGEFRIRGVAAFYGGVPLDAFQLDWWQGVDTPAVYLYHQRCDGVVLSGTARPFTTMSAFCNLGSTPWHLNYPRMAGSVAIQSAFAALDPSPPLLLDLTECAPFNPDLALFECGRYADNGSYHYTADPVQRAANLSAWWAPLASSTGNCTSTAVPTVNGTAPQLYPNPTTTIVVVPEWVGSWLELVDLTGRVLHRERLRGEGMDVARFPAGTYLLREVVHGGSVRVVINP